MLRAVAARVEAGCSDIKVMVSGGNITPGSLPWQAQFAVDDLRAIVEETHRLGLRAAAHVHGASSVVAALAAGFDTLEHVTFMSPEGVDVDPAVLKGIVDAGAVVSVTAGASPVWAPPPAVAARLEAVMDTMLRLHGLGARMVVGSDAGVSPGKPHGVTPHALRILIDGGVSAVAALQMMTSAPADALGLAAVKGTLVAGADADLLAVRGDPARDSEALHDVVGVWSRGARVR
jgi:imidazolonepropionase-like amidohydrolase